jgi:hypothetical protein
MHLSARLRHLAIPVALLAGALSLAAAAPASAAPSAGAVTEVFHACKVIGQPSGPDVRCLGGRRGAHRGAA